MKDSKFTAMPLPPVPSLEERIREIVREEIAAHESERLSGGWKPLVPSSYEEQPEIIFSIQRVDELKLSHAFVRNLQQDRKSVLHDTF